MNKEKIKSAVSELFKVFDELEKENIYPGGDIILNKEGLYYESGENYERRVTIPLKVEDRSLKEILIDIDTMTVNRGESDISIYSGSFASSYGVRWYGTTNNNTGYMIRIESKIDEEKEWFWALGNKELLQQEPSFGDHRDKEIIDFLAYVDRRYNGEELEETPENENSKTR